MKVSSNRPGPVTLPYTKNGKKLSFIFQAGKNELPNEDWNLIKEQHSGPKWEKYYGQILTEFKSLDIIVSPADEVGYSDGKMARAGEFESFDVKTCLELIENTTDRDILQTWRYAEKTLGRNRPIVLEALQRKIAESPQQQIDMARMGRESLEVEQNWIKDHPGR